MIETSADLSMACSPDIWELKMFLWTSANMIAWNDVLLEIEAQNLQAAGVQAVGFQAAVVTSEPSLIS
jgi:hypothetical protein